MAGHEKPRRLPARALPNLGATCYASALLAALYNDARFNEALLSDEQLEAASDNEQQVTRTRRLRELFADMATDKPPDPDNDENLYQHMDWLLGEIASDWSRYQHQDAHELFQRLTETCGPTMAEASKEAFGFQTQTITNQQQ